MKKIQLQRILDQEEYILGDIDNMIGISDWPSIGRYYEVLPGGQGAVLSLVIAPRASELLPSPSQPGTVNADVIIQQQGQYAGIYYQMVQPGISGTIVSSLNYVADPDYGNKGITVSDISPLWKFAAGSYLVLTGLTKMTAAKPTAPITIGDTLATYGIRYTELAQANARLLLAELFGATIPVVPAFYPNVENRSMQQLYLMPPQGWPKPSTASGLLTETENTSLLLKPGSNLLIPPVSISVGSAQPTTAIQVLADGNNTTVYDLALQNGQNEILEIGFVFTMPVDENTVESVTVAADNMSLSKVVNSFALLGVNTDTVELANVHKDKTGMFAAGQTLSCNTYRIKLGDTLAGNSTGVSVSTLAPLNVNAANLFDPGALIYFGNFDIDGEGDIPPTLQEFADRYACPIEQVLAANATFTISSNSAFVLPGTLAWPAEAGNIITVPYTIRASETLNNIASRFNFTVTDTSAVMQLAAANENMPGTITPNMSLTIAVGGTDYTVNTGDSEPSYASVLTTLQQQAPAATLQDIVTATGDTAGVLFASGLFLCPPAKISQDTAPGSVRTLYGISAGSFALANAAMTGLIAAGKTLYNFDEKVTVTTIANDTFNSLIARFADQGVTMSASDIVNANPTIAFISAGAIAFLPPAEIAFSASVGQGGPYSGTVVPLQVSMRLLRPKALIYPSFKTTTGTEPVEMAESDFPAPTNNTDTDSGLTLNDFIAQMKIALPDLRIATGKVTGVVQDLWQINFNADGIKQVNLDGGTTVNGNLQPRFFALKPLYRYLVTRTITVSELKSDGELGASYDLSLQSIDVELWARRFVEDMDQFLSGPYATAVYTDAGMRAQLTAVLDAKNMLIPKIAAGLDTLLVVTDPGKQAGLASAVESLQQQLGVSLSKTYEASVLVQYNSTVQASADLTESSLYGDGNIYSPGGGVLPGISITAAKTDLSEASSFVNFLMMVNNPALNKDIAGTFAYSISHLEFNISSENLPGNYKSSDWLTFIPLQDASEKPAALAGTNPGSTDVPVPLRNFPDLPKIIQQQAVQQAEDGTQTVSDLSLWKYEFSYSHEHAPQDSVLITAEFNLTTPDDDSLAVTNNTDLFTELAQYITVADKLWPMLNGLTGESTYSPEVIASAVGTYAELVTNIGDNWNVRLPQSNVNTGTSDDFIAAISFRFNSRVSYTDGIPVALELTKLDLEPGPTGEWPDAWVYGDKIIDGFTITALYPLTRQTTVQNTTTYTVPADVIVPSTWPQFKIGWSGINVAAVQNARVKMSVERNQNLLSNVVTNPQFVFSTDTVIAPAVVTPLNNFGSPVNINSLGTDLTTALNACFNALFGPDMDGQPVTMEFSYGFELVPPSGDDPGLVTYLPIGLYPNQLLTQDTAGDINAVITDWKDLNDPVITGGEWVFSLQLYSLQTDEMQVLLNIEHLIYRLG